MKLWPLPLLAIGLGVAGVTITLWLSRAYELVPYCRVFIDGCISISAAGRREPSVFVFRGTIIPMATLLMVVWWLNVRWLHGLAAVGPVQRAALHLLGTLSPALLIVYIALIGAPGDEVHAIRQLAIRIYFPAALEALLPDPSRIHNLMQWHATSAFAAWYVLLALVWRGSQGSSHLVS